ncbi:MAG: rhodanese-like domain-containing protein [Desulfobaccales bacterium]
MRSSLWNWLEAAAKEERRMKTVDRKTLKRWLGQQNLFLMDVRSPVAWNLSIAKIEYARRVEENSLALVVQTLPSQQKLVLYCEDGMANCPAMAKKLEKMGVTNLYLLKGGFLAWQGKEYPKVPKEVEEQSETSANL